MSFIVCKENNWKEEARFVLVVAPKRIVLGNDGEFKTLKWV